MKSGARSVGAKGFTVIETLIVLAVTGFLLAAAIFALNGRQNATQFSQGVRDTESRIQKVINEVSSGYYPNSGNFSCNGTFGQPILSTLTNAAQGTNSSCIFLGKVIQFSDNSTTFNVFNVVGVRKTTTGPLTTLVSARPRLIAQGNAVADSNVPNILEVESMPYGLASNDMYYKVLGNPANNPVWAVGFLSAIGSLAAGDDSQQIDVYAIPGVSPGADAKTAVDQINNSFKPTGAAPGSGSVYTTPSAKNPTGGVKVCLQSGSTNQSALLSIGGQGRQLTVSVNIKNNQSCA